MVYTFLKALAVLSLLVFMIKISFGLFSKPESVESS